METTNPIRVVRIITRLNIGGPAIQDGDEIALGNARFVFRLG